jgi:branched-chain amino acid transport system ATP-binding protein
VIALETRSLCKSFGSLAVTQDVSLAFEASLRYAIIGPNGAGKTTYFNLLAGNSAARFRRVGCSRPRRDRSRRAPARARIGIARSFQRNSLFPGLHASRDNLRSPARCAPDGAGVLAADATACRTHAEATRIAEKVGLADAAHPVRQLSYGSQRQLEVALALACQPQVLLLDEPTSGMSPEETARMHALIKAVTAHAHRHRHRARHGHRARFRRPHHRARLRPVCWSRARRPTSAIRRSCASAISASRLRRSRRASP